MKRSLVILLLMILSFNNLKAAQTTSIDEVLSYIQSLDALRNKRHYPDIPPFSEKEYREVLQGGCIVKKWEVGSGTGEKAGAIMKVMNLPAWKMWAIIVDRAHYKFIIPGMKESIILKRGLASTVSYHYIDAPIPFVKDRHQVLVSTTNMALWKRSEGKVMEYYWKKSPNTPELIEKGIREGLIQQVSRKEANEAVIVRHNEGSWFLIPLPNGKTLIEGYTIVDPGGNLSKTPSQFLQTESSLKDTINLMEKWGLEELDKHLKGSHEKILSPDGEFIEPVRLISVFGKSQGNP